MRVGREEQRALAAAGEHFDHRRMPELRRRVLRDALDHLERNHLARNLGEALDAAQHADKTISIDGDDITRIVPADAGFRIRRLQHARLIIVVIAEHQVGTAHVQAPAVGDAVDRDHSMLDCRQHAPDRSRLVSKRRIQRQYRRAFGRAIAFHDAQAEFLEPQSGHLGIELLRAGDDVAHAVEIIRMRLARVAREKGAGAEEVGAVPQVRNFRNHAVSERRRVDVNTHAMQQRQQRAGGKAVGMEYGQRIEEFVGRREIDDGAHLRDIGKQRIVAERDAFGPRFRARSEQDHRRARGVARLRQAARKSERPRNQPQFVEGAELLAQVLDEDDALVAQRIERRIQARHLDELARRYDRANTGAQACTAQCLRARGVIEHRGHPAGSAQPQQQAHRGAQIRHHYADDLAGRRNARAEPRQRQGRLQ